VVKARDGVVRLRISTAAGYFARYRLCVRAPGAAAARCGSFPIFRSGAVWSSSVRLATFGSRSPGVHRATWSLGPSPLGPALRFRR
jgi:hypothetical protein